MRRVLKSSTAAPARRRPADDDDEEEERPRRRRATEDDDEEERPRSRRTTERTTRRRAPEAAPEDEDDDDDPDDDDVASYDDEDRPVRAGWAGYKETRQKGGAFADYLQLEDGEKPTLIKFLEPEPFASYRVHWLEGLTSTRKKSWICLENDCPLCDAGDDQSFKIAFNIVILNKGKPTVKVWEVGPRMAEAIEAKAKDKRTGPIDRPDMYFAVNRTGKRQKTQYHIEAVKERDVEDDFGVRPVTEEDLDRWSKKLFDHTVVKVPTKQKLKALAAELQDEDFDDDEDDD